MVHKITHLQTGGYKGGGNKEMSLYLCWPIAPSYTSSNAGGWVGGCGLSANDYSCAHHVTLTQIDFGDQPPYLAYAVIVPVKIAWASALQVLRWREVWYWIPGLEERSHWSEQGNLSTLSLVTTRSFVHALIGQRKVICPRPHWTLAKLFVHETAVTENILHVCIC